MVHIIVSPAELKTSPAPWVVSLAATLGTLFLFYLIALSHEFFDSLSNKNQSVHNLVFLHLGPHVFSELYDSHSELLG